MKQKARVGQPGVPNAASGKKFLKQRRAALGHPLEVLTPAVLEAVSSKVRGDRASSGARRREVLLKLLGARGQEPETQQAVAQALGVSSQAVGQVFQTAVRMARATIEAGKEKSQ